MHLRLIVIVAVFLTDCDAINSQEQVPVKEAKQAAKPGISDNFLTWPANNSESIKEALIQFLTRENAPKAILEMAKNANFGKITHTQLIQWLEDLPICNRVLEKMQTANAMQDLPLTPISDKVIKNHLLLEFAMALVRHNLHDEAFSILQQLDQRALIEPGLAIVYKSICHHQLVDTRSALPLAELLMANLEKLPPRYRSISQSLYADLKKTQTEPLSHVAKLMADASRRQRLERTSQKVLKQEEAIVESLEKIIKDLEKQRKEMRAASNSSSKPSQQDQESEPAKMASDAGSGKNSGEVDPTQVNRDGDWGDMNNEAKSIAVKNLVRDLPPHFQSLMKAYFQKLAENKK